MRFASAAAALVLTLAACRHHPPLSEDVLKNTTVPLDNGATVQLVDGAYKSPGALLTAPDFASRPSRVTLALIRHGDLDGDRWPDAGVIYSFSPPNDERHVYFAVFRNDRGTPVLAGHEKLGDRIGVLAVRPEKGRFEIDANVQQPGDKTCCPSKRVTWAFTLQHGRMVRK